MTSSAFQNRYDGIQVLRAVAAIAVVVFHAAQRIGLSVGLGQAGVDIFFVISGFVMWTVTERGKSPLAFMSDRITRIVPLYWVATIAMAAAAWLKLFPRTQVSIEHLALSMFFVPHRSLTSPAEYLPLLFQGWTLNYEMFFYALFAVALLLPRAMQGVALMAWLSVALVVMGWLAPPRGAVPAFYENSIVIEFCLGLLLGVAATRGMLTGRPLLGWLSILIGIALFGLYVHTGAYGPRLVHFGVPAFFLVTGILLLECAGYKLGARPLLFVGDASYSIYLFHTFAIAVVVKLLPTSASIQIILACAVASIVVGGAIHLAIETPLLEAYHKRRRPLDEPLIGRKSGTPINLTAAGCSILPPATLISTENDSPAPIVRGETMMGKLAQDVDRGRTDTRVRGQTR
ncbi:acyltransferase [Bradyrhizobium sp. CCGUVB1N3]|uniref:acyltransferase family protein n=1 Tax=Bradyrhizobium sp. CCGUVB1N3 TaxID=2949629 RepID=UPI0020B29531|nr:acyltransferase [Bradyrhizobium sp. CCGUVB1N3]MCP3472127.1 acyltransferase [Bradyrhizobium sp. CCGUVB1N3]